MASENDVGFKPGIYRHHKGGVYAALWLSRESTNGPGEGHMNVTYYSFTKRDFCTRRLSEFLEPVTLPEGVTPIAQVSFRRFVFLRPFPDSIEVTLRILHRALALAGSTYA